MSTFGLSEALEFGVLTTLKATFVLVVGWIVAALFRRRPAAEQHLVWAFAIAGVILLPLLGSALTGWTVPVKTASWMTRTPNESIAPQGFIELAPSPEPQAAPTTYVSPGVGDESPVFRPDSGPVSPKEPLSPGALAVLFWATGATLLALWTLLGHGRANQLARRAPLVMDLPLRDRARRIGEEVGIGRSVRLLEGGSKEMPKTGGVLRPWLLLPAGASEWPIARQEAVLRHEFAHVKRYDTLMEVFVNAACAIYWFHPLVWLASKQLRLAREHACDDVVLLSGMRPSDYAADLLAIAQRFQDRVIVAEGAIAMARLSSLRSRLSAVLDDRPRLHRIGVSRLVPACVGGLAVLVLLGGSRPVRASDLVGTFEVDEFSDASGLPQTQVDTPGGEAIDRNPLAHEPEVVPSEMSLPVNSNVPDSADQLMSAESVVDRAIQSVAPDGPLEAEELLEQLAAVQNAAQLRVTYTVRGKLIGGEGSAVRSEIFSAIRGDGHLDSLNMSTSAVGRDGSFTARFLFDSLSEFDRWYSTNNAEHFHQAIGNPALTGDVQIDLSVGQPR